LIAQTVVTKPDEIKKTKLANHPPFAKALGSIKIVMAQYPLISAIYVSNGESLGIFSR